MIIYVSSIGLWRCTLFKKLLFCSQPDADFLQMPGPEDTSNDLMLALMLQHEFDTEHDDILRRVEDKFNSSSTGS